MTSNSEFGSISFDLPKNQSNVIKVIGVGGGGSNAINHMFRQGIFETLIKLADEGLGITLLPYLHAVDLHEKNKSKLMQFKDPKPAREVSLIFPKNELKIHIIEALRNTIDGIIRGAIAFHDVQIISPKPNKKGAY